MPYVSVSACAPSLCFQSQAFLQFVTLFFLSLSTSSLNDAHPLAVKLNKLIEDGKIPQSCIYYKFLNHTMSFALTDPKTASGFKWDDEVCEFFSTIKYLGGERTRKFVRGPGFFGTGRGGEKEFKSFADFNLYGPSLNATKRCQSGYTTESGMIKPHLQSLHSLCQHPRADLHAIVDNEKVRAIPVALASDGTALKPGLEYDSRQKQVIGLTYKVDEKFVKKHPLPDPEKIKTSLINNADVTIATSLDNFRPKSVTGEEIFSCMEDSIRTIQTCQNCLKGQRSVKHIVTSEASMSKCEECLKAKSVCASCKNMGQVSHHPSLRACDSCSDRNVTCQKLVVMAVATDCKECNKKALVRLSDMADGKELPPELELVVPLPDVVHIGKRFKCSWSNWFINLDGEFSNLVLLRSLRNNAEAFIKKKLRKLLLLKCVRNKDRMAVEPIIRLTRPEVLKVLEDVKFVVHTIVPEQYRFWKSNQRGVCPHPIAVS